MLRCRLFAALALFSQLKGRLWKGKRKLTPGPRP